MCWRLLSVVSWQQQWWTASINQCTADLRSHFDDIHKNAFLMRAVAFGKHGRLFACDDVIRVSVHSLHIKSRLVNLLVVNLVPVCNCVAVSQS